MPETLQALVAARLDGLTADERHLVQDGAVLGKTFTKQGLAALTGSDTAALEPILASLLRKEVLSVQADPLSPDRGQYAYTGPVWYGGYSGLGAYDLFDLYSRRSKRRRASSRHSGTSATLPRSLPPRASRSRTGFIST